MAALQVYKARLRSTGEQVAVKVQRPGALSTISKVQLSACFICQHSGASSLAIPCSSLVHLPCLSAALSSCGCVHPQNTGHMLWKDSSLVSSSVA